MVDQLGNTLIAHWLEMGLIDGWACDPPGFKVDRSDIPDGSKLHNKLKLIAGM